MLSDEFKTITTFPCLLSAFELAQRGKRAREDVAKFRMELEPNLFKLQNRLRSGAYLPGGYRTFSIYERKPRLISVAPFVDRVVHHCLMAYLAPKMDLQMYPFSFACRPEKGVHKAVDYYQFRAQRYAYILKLDISAYFASIRHDVLLQQLQWFQLPKDIYDLIGKIIASTGSSGVGLPIGNLTSQWLANWYLNEIDWWLQSQVGGYFRYVDDLYLFADDKVLLWQTLAELKKRLTNLGLVIAPHKISLRRTTEKVDVLGYQVSRTRRWLRNDNGHAFLKRFKRMVARVNTGKSNYLAVQPSIFSWIGHSLHGETLGLRTAIFSEHKFYRV